MKSGTKPGTQPALQVSDLRMSYGRFDVLHGVELCVHRGEVLALLGPNGAGKTTTVEILEGFRIRTGGEAEVLGSDPGRADEAWRARIGVVLQSWRDHAKWRVREVLDNLGRFYAPYSDGDRRRPYPPDELLTLVGLTDRAQAVVGTLSGGQRRRLDVAIGLVGNPELLFLDEPTVGFDPQSRQEFHRLVHRLSETDTTILLTTHDLDEAEKLADRIAILAGGVIVAAGTAAELATRFAGRAEVRYTLHGESYVESSADATTFTRELFARHGTAVGDLEVRRVRLEDVYLSMVREYESDRQAALDGQELTGVSR